VRALIEDDERNLWVGTSNGLNRLSEGRFVTYGRPEGLRDATVQALAEGRGNDVWIGTSSAGAFRLHGETLSPLGVLPEANVVALHEAADGGVWLSTADGRLFRVKAGAASDMTPRAADGSVVKISVISEHEGAPLFAGATLGLGRIKNRRFVPLHPHAPAIRSIFTILADRQGTLWLGSSDGLVRVRGGQYTFFTTRDGLPDDRVRSIWGEDDGTLWLATMGGLCRFRDGQIRALTTSEGLPDVLLRLVLDDGQDNLWLSSVGHLFRLSKPGIADVLAGKARRVTAFELDTADGLRSTEVPEGASPGFRGHDGRLWFATSRGASVIDPAQRKPRSAPPPLRIERVIVDGDEDRQDSYPPGKGTLEIHYTALSYSAPERLRFRHKLRGLDEAWTYAGDSRVARYTNLRPHRYVFMLDVADSDGVWSGKPLELAFTIEPHWYQTPLFFWAVVALLASAVWGAYLLRMLAMRRRFAAVLEERNRLAREMHDTLAQNLGGVAFQLEAVKLQHSDVPPAVKEKLEETSKMIRYAVAEAYRAIRDLRAQVLQTRDLGAAISETAQRAAAEANLELTIDVDGGAPRLSASVENNLLRIVQEAITNTVTHSGARHLEVGLQFSRELLRLRVRDDGCGFDTQRAAAPGSGHYGLMGMHERANRIGARLTFTSQVAGGTEVLVELSLRPARRKDRAEP
jgi:signal transduction histidine kinase